MEHSKSKKLRASSREIHILRGGNGDLQLQDFGPVEDDDQDQNFLRLFIQINAFRALIRLYEDVS